MQWFKHKTDMSFDPKVKRVIRKYGAEGYGLYCYVLESIARGLSESSPYPELEEMSEDIAAELKIDSRRIEEMMMFMVKQGLFDYRDATDRVICMKMIDYLDEYHRKAGKSSNIRKALQAIELRHCPDKLLTESGDVAQKREDKEENREEAKGADTYTSEFLDFWRAYPSSEGKRPAFTAWKKLAKHRPPVDDIIAKLEAFKQTEKWKSGYVRNPATWINQRGWEDEIQPTNTQSTPTPQNEPRYCFKHGAAGYRLDDDGACPYCKELEG